MCRASVVEKQGRSDLIVQQLAPCHPRSSPSHLQVRLQVVFEAFDESICVRRNSFALFLYFFFVCVYPSPAQPSQVHTNNSNAETTRKVVTGSKCLACPNTGTSKSRCCFVIASGGAIWNFLQNRQEGGKNQGKEGPMEGLDSSSPLSRNHRPSTDDVASRSIQARERSKSLEIRSHVYHGLATRRNTACVCTQSLRTQTWAPAGPNSVLGLQQQQDPPCSSAASSSPSLPSPPPPPSLAKYPTSPPPTQNHNMEPSRSWVPDTTHTRDPVHTITMTPPRRSASLYSIILSVCEPAMPQLVGAPLGER